MKWILGIIIFVLLVVLAVGGFFIYQYLGSQGLTLNLTGPTEINLGVPFQLTVNFNNQAKNIAKNAHLNLNLPEGAVLVGAPAGQRVLTKELGDLAIGKSSQENFSLLITNGENAVKRFTASLVYENQTIGQTQFEVQANFDIRVKSSNVSLDLFLPNQVLSGENFKIQINYRNLTTETASGLEIQTDYPIGFITTSSKVWQLPDLVPAASGTIVINGQLSGLSNSVFAFGAKIIKDEQYIINQQTANITIAPSPLELTISTDKSENYVAQFGDQLTYNLNYKNNSGIGLTAVVIKTKLSGAMFDFTTLQSNASFNSLTNTLIWNASNLPQLQMLAAGDNGTATFMIKLKNNFPIRRLSDKNFSLKVSGEISSPTVPPNLTTNQTISLAASEIKVAGAIKIETKIDYQSGIWPSKVNQPTQYNVHWLITNYSTDVRQVEVRAFLEAGVRVISTFSSSTPVNYNDRTQEAVWLIDKIPATKGVINAPLEAVFQIEAIPNITQVGNIQPLIKETTITALDDFTQIQLQNQSQPIVTASPVIQ